ncbi:Uncharacterized conserved protein [Phaffia rhodozyma]|uniref:Uncharacterized conserved protein n=1 Tax=Phaffia rhodozyma TaxID=264483 RepID=A0A0F7SF82_PHARH|nr:Uncharacterized conserved protein [Phaffia rhodozyma]
MSELVSSRSARSYSISGGSTFPEERPSDPTLPSKPPELTLEEEADDDDNNVDNQPPPTVQPALSSPRFVPPKLFVPSESDRESKSRDSSRPTSPPRKESVVPNSSLRIPQLCSPGLFAPLPSIDPLSSLLTKYIPSSQRPYRDIEGRYEGVEITQLVKAGSWRALARLARDVTVSTDPENVDLIFEMHHLRQLSLLSLHLHSQHVHELHLLFAALAHLPPGVRARLSVPFSLELMFAKKRGLGELTRLLARCRSGAQSSGAESGLWRERVGWVGGALAGALIEAGDLNSAITLLLPLTSPSQTPPIYLLGALLRLQLAIGNLPSAKRTMDQIESREDGEEREKKEARAIWEVGNRNWEGAEKTLAEAEGGVAANARSIVHLFQNRPEEAIETLERAIELNPSEALVEPLIFNLATLYELRFDSEIASKKKVELLIKTTKFASDGLKPACLKLS